LAVGNISKKEKRKSRLEDWITGEDKKGRVRLTGDGACALSL